jgi:PHD/YefM family antitoxin component YafN of YafNO toxin-antitoxin module
MEPKFKVGDKVRTRSGIEFIIAEAIYRYYDLSTYNYYSEYELEKIKDTYKPVLVTRIRDGDIVLIADQEYHVIAVTTHYSKRKINIRYSELSEYGTTYRFTEYLTVKE